MAKDDERRKRLAAALRDNLRRRKAAPTPVEAEAGAQGAPSPGEDKD